MTTTARRTIAAAIALTLGLGSALLGGTAANAATTPPAIVAGAPENPTEFTEYNGLLYLAGIAEGDIYDTLFSFDGTTFTQVPNSPIGIAQMYSYDGQLVIEAVDDINAPPVDYSLYTYDGSTFTQFVGFTSPNGFTEAGGVLFFGATVGGNQGLWQYTGGTASAVPGGNVDLDANHLSEFNGSIYFSAEINPTTDKLFTYNPATPATPAAAVPGSPDGPGPIAYYDGTGYLPANGGLYTFDGTTFTAVPVPVSPFALTPFEGALYFSGFDGTDYASYYLRDGVTTPVTGPGTETEHYFEYNGSLYYGAFSDIGISLAAISGGVATIVPGDTAYPGAFVLFQGKLYFNSFGSTIQMYVLTSTPALASTGVDPRMPALLALVLLGLGAAVVVRARASRA